MKKAVVYILLLMGLVHCSSVPLENSARDQVAKQFLVKPDRANIYIYRNKFVGGFYKYPISVNGRALGVVSSSTYYVLAVKEGLYKIKESYSWPVEYSLSVKNGRNYFIFVDTAMGFFSPNISIKEQDESDGRDSVLSRSLAQRQR